MNGPNGSNGFDTRLQQVVSPASNDLKHGLRTSIQLSGAVLFAPLMNFQPHENQNSNRTSAANDLIHLQLLFPLKVPVTHLKELKDKKGLIAPFMPVPGGPKPFRARQT